MLKVVLLFILFLHCCQLQSQNSSDTIIKKQTGANADDPSQFLTRIEVFNELQKHNKKNEFYFNQTVFRTIVKVGKSFTTRIDLPYVYNSVKTAGSVKHSGIGDISFRLLGFKFFENLRSAFTASLEISLNTAESPLLGTGKNLLIPVVSYTLRLPERKMLIAFLFQQTNSISGDETRNDISFSKLQFITIKYFSRKTWMVLAPEWFLDYANGGLSMNMRSRFTFAPTPRTNLWITPSAGIFGEFAGRYTWSIDVGGRYFMFREKRRS